MPRQSIITTENKLASLTQRTAKLLLGQGLTTEKQIIEQYPETLLSIRGFGFKSLREVERCFSLGHYNPRDPAR